MPDYIYSSVKGTASEENRDDLLIIDELGYRLFVVFDGLTSARNGKTAPGKAKKYLRENYRDHLEQGGDIRQLMHNAHRLLLATGLYEPYTTYCALLHDRQGNECYSWLGDSRLYEIDDGSIKQLTCDDGYDEHVVTRCLGLETLKIDDFRQEKLTVKNAFLLLCTDGFYRVIETCQPEFLECTSKRSLKDAKDAINMLISGKNPDDATFILLRFHANR